MMQRALVVFFILTLTAAPASAFCFQDQYGIQYNFLLEKQYGLIVGDADADPGCDATFFNVFGSFNKVAGKYVYELTMINPLGDTDAVCYPLYKIKGQWPAGDWYYSPPFDVYPLDQSFAWGRCSAPRPALTIPGLSETGQIK